MVTSLNRGTPAREAGYEMMQYIAARLTATSGGAAITQKVGTLPAGAVVTGVHSRVVTAYATAAAMGISLGQSGTFSDFASGLNTAAGGTRLEMLATVSQPLTADLDVWAQISSGATAGDSYISVWFQKPMS